MPQKPNIMGAAMFHTVMDCGRVGEAVGKDSRFSDWPAFIWQKSWFRRGMNVGPESACTQIMDLGEIMWSL